MSEIEQNQNNEEQVIERNGKRATVIGWLVVAAISAIMLLRALSALFLIGDNPRDWDYVTVPYVPGEEYSSTTPLPAPDGEVPNQIELPPAADEQGTK